jgi:acyl-coenzyme A synthetase/AMP-(fatty) acid ligase
LYLDNQFGDVQLSPSDVFHQRLKQTCSTYRAHVLLEDRERGFTGKHLLHIFECVKDQLELISPLGGRVAICCRDSLLQAQLILATFYAGRVPVVLGTADYEDVHEVQSKIGLSGILAENDLTWHALPMAPMLVFDHDGELSERLPGRLRAPVRAAPTGCGLVLFTSGTMGHQKAVNLPLQGMLDTYQRLGEYFSLSSQDVATILLPISHTFALNTQLLPAFLNGAKSVFLNRTSHLGRQYESIGKSGGTFIASVTDLLRLLKRERDVRGLPLCETVRHVQIAAGKISDEHLRDMRDLFPNAVLHKGYGMTETIRTSMISSRDDKFSSETCGRPLPGQEVEIRDESGRLVPAGMAGQIFVRSNTTLLAYDQRPSGSSLDDSGFFPTGDWGYLDDQGYLTCIDRLDRVFKIAGKKVSAVEMERVAAEFDQVEDAKCAPIVDAKKGLRPVLFVELSEQESFKNLRLADFESCLRENLEPSKVPRDVVIAERLPRTANAKVKIDVLQKLWERKSLETLSPATGYIRFHRLLSGS